jgi:hypothetical protein
MKVEFEETVQIKQYSSRKIFLCYLLIYIKWGQILAEKFV